jgi:hypothetical protein
MVEGIPWHQKVQVQAEQKIIQFDLDDQEMNLQVRCHKQGIECLCQTEF